MDARRGGESDSDGGAATIPSAQQPNTGHDLSSDIKHRTGQGESEDLPDFDPALAYEKEIRDGRLRDLSRFVHPSASATPQQGVPTYREEDRLLVEHLAKNNFAGPEYDLVAERLVTTGYRYCLSWLKNGKMHKKCRDSGRPVGDLPEAVELQHLKDMATDTAVEGARLFRRVALVGGKWRPDGGASLLTYYVGACIQVFPNVYRRWYREYRDHWRSVPHDVMPDSESPSVSDEVTLRILLNTLRQRLDEPTWVALKMKAEGASYAEIKEALGRPNEKSVENLLGRGRQRAAKIISGEGGHHV